MSQDITPAIVAHVATLANLTVTEAEKTSLAHAFSETLLEVDKLSQVDTKNVEPSSHVTGLSNVWREDVIDADRQFSQQQALSQAPHVLRGYVVVDRVLVEE